MSDYNFFYDDWLNPDQLIHDHISSIKVNLEPSFFNNLKGDQESLKKYRTNAAIKCSEILGNNPVLCFSGGVDSQAMLSSWIEAGLEVDVYTLNFKDNLNKQDVDHARMYCKKHGIKLNEIEFDVVNFLSRDNFSTGVKYKSSSPHFNVHYRLFEILQSMGYTGVCCGGDAPIKYNGLWGGNLLPAPMNFINFSRISKFPVQGSFLSFYPELAWSIGLFANQFIYKSVYSKDGYLVLNRNQEFLQYNTDERYRQKISSYLLAGFNIIPQDKKYTGFELVKDYFANLHNDGWAFEKLFRNKLNDLFSKKIISPRAFELTPDQEKAISSVYSKHFASR